MITNSSATQAQPEDFSWAKLPVYLWRLGLGGVVGQVFMLISTHGRRSGLIRRAYTPYFFVNGKKYVYADPDAQWYQNVLAHPLATIQTAYGDEPVSVRKVTDPDEIAEVFAHLQQNRPALARAIYQQVGVEESPADLAAAADRLHLITFEPTDAPTPMPQDADLRWLTVAVVGFVAWLWQRRARSRR